MMDLADVERVVKDELLISIVSGIGYSIYSENTNNNEMVTVMNNNKIFALFVKYEGNSNFRFHPWNDETALRMKEDGYRIDKNNDVQNVFFSNEDDLAIFLRKYIV